MDFASVLAPWQWAALGGATLGIVLLYFLKLRREPVVVSSTLLWQRTLEDLYVNRPFRWLRINTLLLLQLLMMGLVAAACLRPVFSQWATGARHFIILIDNSASMTATDVSPNRLEAAKEAAIREVVDGLMDGDDVAMVIAFNDRARVVCSYTADRGRVRQRIRSIRPSHRRTDITEALRLAAALANPDTVKTEGLLFDEQGRPIAAIEPVPATVIVYSDGRFKSPDEALLGDAELIYRPIGKADAANVGIVAFAVRELPERPGRAQAFVEVGAWGSAPARAEMRMFWNDTLVAVRSMQLEAGQTEQLSFELPSGTGTARVSLRVDDHLAADNEASVVVAPGSRARVLLLSEGNRWLEAALGTEAVRDLAEVRVADREALDNSALLAALRTGHYDLVVSDGIPLPELPEANTLLFGILPPDLAELESVTIEAPRIIDADPSHPLLRYVNLAPVLIARATIVRPPAGAEVLARSEAGPMIWLRRRGAYEDCIVAFRLAEDGRPLSDWHRRVSFPIFLMNALGYLAGAEPVRDTRPLQPGEPIRLPFAQARDGSPIVVTPTGEQLPMRGVGGSWIFANTDNVGLYTVMVNDQAHHQVAVALTDAEESRIQVQQEAQVGPQTVKAQESVRLARRELWPLLAALALAVCLAEWYIYNRRISL